ncbi:ribonuclease H-like domain-containing protein [Tanacetum coccineum]
MITRSQLGIVKPIDRLSLHTSSISYIPKNPSHALKDPNWRNAMYDKYNALVKNGTWLLVPRPAGVNMVRSTWLFKHKFHADGTLSRYKARLVVNGSSQQLGVDFDETFSLVVKPAIIRIVLSLAVSRQWHIYLLDVKNAFLNGDLSEAVYMHQPPGFVNNRYPHHKYALHLLERAYMVTCNPSRTPVDTESKLGPEGAPFSRFAFICMIRESHISCSQASNSGYCVFLGGDLLSWPAKQQHTLSRSCAETEYWVVANVVAETAWLRNLLRELHSNLSTTTLVYCDNISAVYMSVNPVQHQRTKHIEIDIHFVRDMVTAGEVRVIHVPSRFQYANIFTKGLPSALFEEF